MTDQREVPSVAGGEKAIDAIERGAESIRALVPPETITGEQVDRHLVDIVDAATQLEAEAKRLGDYLLEELDKPAREAAWRVVDAIRGTPSHTDVVEELADALGPRPEELR